MTTEPDEQLPSWVETAWAPAKPAKPRGELGLDLIIEAGLRVGDRHGLAAVSMARVAAEAGYTTMALYRHVANKEELLALLQDAAPGLPPTHPDGEHWRDGLERWARNLHTALTERSWTLAIPITTPPLGPVSVAWMNRFFEVARPTGLGATELLSILNLLSGYIRTEAALAAAHQPGAATAHPEPAVDYEGALRRFVTAPRFPACAAILEAGPLFQVPTAAAHRSASYLFDYGLDRLLDGVEVAVDAGRSLHSDDGEQYPGAGPVAEAIDARHHSHDRDSRRVAPAAATGPDHHSHDGESQS